jgi:uncharacterized membrane protein
VTKDLIFLLGFIVFTLGLWLYSPIICLLVDGVLIMTFAAFSALTPTIKDKEGGDKS